ncbi:hypothetical protein KXX14_006260, partial [Aspergillus fumigatus]
QKSEHLGEQEKVGCPEAEKPRKKRIAQPGGGDNPRQGQDRAKSHAGPSLSGVEPRCKSQSTVHPIGNSQWYCSVHGRLARVFEFLRDLEDRLEEFS